MYFPGSCPWFSSWDHHTVFQLKKKLVVSRLRMQDNHGTVSTSSRRQGTPGCHECVLTDVDTWDSDSFLARLIDKTHLFLKLILIHTR
jgi:hypothetical protein